MQISIPKFPVHVFLKNTSRSVQLMGKPFDEAGAIGFNFAKGTFGSPCLQH